MALNPTVKIPALLAASTPITGDEVFEAVQGGVSVQIHTRSLVLPTDALLTVVNQVGNLPGSRYLQNSASVIIVDGGNGGPLSFVATGTTGALPVGRQLIAPASGNLNNQALTDTSIGMLDINTAAGAVNLTGIAAPLIDGLVLIITNIGTQLLNIMAENAASSAANRFRLASDLTLIQNDGLAFRYMSAVSRWVRM